MLIPIGIKGIHFVSEGFASRNDLHVGDGRQTAIHGVGGDGSRVQLVHLAKVRQVGQLSPPSQQHHIRRLFFGQQASRFLNELLHHFRCPLSFWNQRAGGSGAHAISLRVCLLDMLG